MVIHEAFYLILKKKELLFFVEKATRYTILLSSDMKDWVSLKKRIMGQGGYSSEMFQISGDFGFLRIVRD